MIIQAGESDGGREFAASDADVIFSKYDRLDEAPAFYRDVKGRLARYGRGPDELKVIPTAIVVIADTDEDAAAYSAEISRAPGRSADRDRAPGGGLGARPVRVRPRRITARGRGRTGFARPERQPRS
jgi:alkanesulfonate monooxygenase SsuD/methylene tetrahydromethanopterin reductase-like flavin-dependent oxidoreductase (luciferase family)